PGRGNARRILEADAGRDGATKRGGPAADGPAARGARADRRDERSARGGGSDRSEPVGRGRRRRTPLSRAGGRPSRRAPPRRGRRRGELVRGHGPPGAALPRPRAGPPGIRSLRRDRAEGGAGETRRRVRRHLGLGVRRASLRPRRYLLRRARGAATRPASPRRRGSARADRFRRIGPGNAGGGPSGGTPRPWPSVAPPEPMGHPLAAPAPHDLGPTPRPELRAGAPRVPVPYRQGGGPRASGPGVPPLRR